jgi:hypothetical protein
MGKDFKVVLEPLLPVALVLKIYVLDDLTPSLKVESVR